MQVTIDGPFQALVARALEARSRAAGSGRGAVVVIDPASGAVLALASYPWPEVDLYSAKDTIDRAGGPPRPGAIWALSAGLDVQADYRRRCA